MENQGSRIDIVDEEHLKLLSLFHFIKGALTIGFSFLGIIYFLFMSVIFKMVDRIEHQRLYYNGEIPFEIFSYLMFMVWAILIMALVFGMLQIVSGYFIKRKQHRIFSFVIGIIQLIEIPYGTILGIMTIIVLSKSSVQQKYQIQKAV